MINKLKALLAGWGTIVFATSILIYIAQPNTGKMYHKNTFINTLRSIWEVADEIAPWIKLSIVIIFGLLTFAFGKFEQKSTLFFYFSSIVFSLVAVLGVLTLMSIDYSRGYGIGLTGKRFDKDMIPIYWCGAVLDGLVYSYTYKRLYNKEKVG
jgi:hypothetical protein